MTLMQTFFNFWETIFVDPFHYYLVKGVYKFIPKYSIGVR
jgi:hypothetical protein